MSVFIKQILDFLKNLCFPIKCCCCGEFVDSEGLCADCWKKIKWISDPKCKICGLPFEIEVDAVCPTCLREKPHFDKAVAVFEYDKFSKGMILKFKHRDTTYIAPLLGEWMYRAVSENIKEADVIIPVPIHFLKRLKRKYNQSELLARELSRLSGIEYKLEILQKIKSTPQQEGLSKEKRMKNIRKSFGIDDKKVNLINGKKVILVDDVLTTGATVNECAKVLKKYGALSVVIVTIARVSV